MTFADTVTVHTSLPAWRRLARSGVAMAAAAVLLSACGGGDQVKEFSPVTKDGVPGIMSFGDEGSALVSDTVALSGGGTATIRGLKYGANSTVAYSNFHFPSNSILAPEQELVTSPNSSLEILAFSSQTAWGVYPATSNYSGAPLLTAVESLGNADVAVVRYQGLLTQVDGGPAEPLDINYRYLYSCEDNPLWIQSLANSYKLGYKDQCPTETRSGAVTYAQAGATVATTATQVAGRLASIGKGTLVTLMVGQNDILNAYQQVKGGAWSMDQAKARMYDEGGALAAIINDIYKTGAHVLFVKLADVGLTPYARAEGGTAAENLTALTVAFNNGVLNKVKNDGKQIGLVNLYDETRRIYNYVREGDTYDNFNNISDAICDATSRKPDGSAVALGAAAPSYGTDAMLYCTNNTLKSGISTSTYFWAGPVHLSPGAHAILGSLANQRVRDQTF